VNIPGLLLGPSGDQIVTVDFDWAQKAAVTDQYTCTDSGDTWDSGNCWTVTRTFKLVTLSGTTATTASSTPLDGTLKLLGVQQGDARFFFPATTESYSPAMLVLGAQGGALTSATVSLDATPVSPKALGTKVYFIQGSQLSLVDATAATPTLSKVGDLSTDTGMHLSLSGTTAIISLGDSGVQTLAIP
jgi:hypothetical protein